MDDLTSKITQLLNDPGGLDMVKNLASSILAGNTGGNSSSGEPAAQDEKPDNMQQNEPENVQSEPAVSDNSSGSLLGGLIPDIPISPQQLSMIMKTLGSLKSTEKDDSNIKLLMALKPHLSAERQKKADNAAKMLKLIKLLPLVKDIGIFDIF